MRYFIIVETEHPDVEDILRIATLEITDKIGFDQGSYSVQLVKDMGNNAGKTIVTWGKTQEDIEELTAQD